MDPLALNRLVEKAKAEATATGATTPPKDVLDSPDEFGIQKEALGVKAEELASGLEKVAEQERRSNLYITKLLTALDVMADSEVN